MADPTTPAIPVSLARLPTIGGPVVPWIPPQMDGRYLFGAINQERTWRALRERRCGVSGGPLDEPVVLLMRLSDLPRKCTAEPALHPWYAAYTTIACRHVGCGRLRFRDWRVVDVGPGWW